MILFNPLPFLHLLYKGIQVAIDSVTAPCFFSSLGVGETFWNLSVSVLESNYSAVFLFQGLSMGIHIDSCLIEPDTI